MTSAAAGPQRAVPVGDLGRLIGIEPRQVLLTRLHDVAAVQDALQALLVGVPDQRRPAVRVDHDWRLIGECFDDSVGRARHGPAYKGGVERGRALDWLKPHSADLPSAPGMLLLSSASSVSVQALLAPAWAEV